MGGNHSRRKGHQFERNVAIALRHVFPEVRRQLEYHAADCKGVDLANTGLYRVQCKKLRAYASIATINEVEADRMLGEVPVLVTAGDALEPMVVLPFEEFVRLVDKSEGR